jgi:hypothetical protein
MDPDTPLVIPSCNYESYIYKDAGQGIYLVDSCNNHNYWNDLEGVMYGDEWGYTLDEKHFFYDPNWDIMMKHPPYISEEEGYRERWCNNGHLTQKIILETGEVVCPECDSHAIESAKLSSEPGRRSAVDVDKIIDRLTEE